MNADPKMEEKLWMYIDGQLDPNDRSFVERLVETDVAWKAKYRELLEINSLLQSSELDSPSLRFTKNVMEEIARVHIAPATRTYINKRIIWGIGLFFIVILAGILVYGFAQLGTGGGEASEIGKAVSGFNFSRIFSDTWINVLLGVNVVLGLVFLDFYLTNKRKRIQENKHN